jgi:hypothetical protein
LILRIPQEDIESHEMGEINLTPARFDNGPSVGSGVIEEEIVTSSGPFIIRWKFRQVKLDYVKERKAGVATAVVIESFLSFVICSFVCFILLHLY